jgi:hypothetical protein
MKPAADLDCICRYNISQLNTAFGVRNHSSVIREERALDFPCSPRLTVCSCAVSVLLRGVHACSPYRLCPIRRCVTFGMMVCLLPCDDADDTTTWYIGSDVHLMFTEAVVDT